MPWEKYGNMGRLQGISFLDVAGNPAFCANLESVTMGDDDDDGGGGDVS